MDFNPARRFLDALAGVVWPPAFNKTHPENTQPPEVIHPDTSCCWQTWEDNRTELGAWQLAIQHFFWNVTKTITWFFFFFWSTDSNKYLTSKLQEIFWKWWCRPCCYCLWFTRRSSPSNPKQTVWRKQKQQLWWISTRGKWRELFFILFSSPAKYQEEHFICGRFPLVMSLSAMNHRLNHTTLISAMSDVINKVVSIPLKCRSSLLQNRKNPPQANKHFTASIYLFLFTHCESN